MYRKEYGSADVLELRDIPRPEPKDQELLIRVRAGTVNRTDCGFLRGLPWIVRLFSGFPKPKIPIMGSEFAGEIAAVGKKVQLFKEGERVFGFSDSRFGAHADYMLFGEKEAVGIIPSSLTFEQAAPITEGAHYALCDLRAAKVERGQRILINGATGAIGSAAVQLSKFLGLEVTAVCATPHLQTIRNLGTDTVIDYTQTDFTQSGGLYDVVFDAVGKSSFAQCKPLLSKRGLYMSTELGPNYQNPFLAMAGSFSSGKKVLFPIPTINKEDIKFLGDLTANGQLKPLVDRSYPLEQVPDAFHYVGTGMKTGNVLISY